MQEEVRASFPGQFTQKKKKDLAHNKRRQVRVMQWNNNKSATILQTCQRLVKHGCGFERYIWPAAFCNLVYSLSSS